MASLGYWGFHSGKGVVIQVGLGIGSPIVAALIWGLFGAPGAKVPIVGPLHLILEFLIFGIAAVALYGTGHSNVAWLFFAIVVVNRILMYVWDQ
jgi:hypothetical protein